MDRQKSAEGILGRSIRLKARTCNMEQEPRFSMANQDTDRSAGMPGTTSDGSGRNPREHGAGVSVAAMSWEHFRSETTQLMNAVVELRPYLKEHWSRIKEELLVGSYRPSGVREVLIPKPGGRGVRKLGIPTVVDRLIQQALHQVLSPIFDPFFSEHSYGFRPGRSAHQAVLQAREYVYVRSLRAPLAPRKSRKRIPGALAFRSSRWRCGRRPGPGSCRRGIWPRRADR